MESSINKCPQIKMGKDGLKIDLKVSLSFQSERSITIAQSKYGNTNYSQVSGKSLLFQF